jgi:hypothetical protein
VVSGERMGYASRWEGSEGTFQGLLGRGPCGYRATRRRRICTRDPAVRNEILRVNHDDPWQGGHFGERRTKTTITRHLKIEDHLRHVLGIAVVFHAASWDTITSKNRSAVLP